jgi:predicted double-glycine peptidase
MVFSFFGLFKSEEYLARAAGTNSDIGTEHHNMIAVATREGFYTYVNNNSTLDELKRFVGRGLPVIVDFIEPGDEEPHYAVVIGFSRGNIILNDPANGEGFTLSEEEFISRWRDTTTHSVRWMMVVSKEDLELGTQYRPAL